MSTRRALTATAVLAVALLALHARVYLPFLSDDALISHAERLLAGQGLTWTDGPRVEGYSNLLWLPTVAALGGLGLDLIVAARLLGFAGMALVLASLAARFGRRAPESWLPAALALPLFALARALRVTADQPLRWSQQASDFEIGSVGVRGPGAEAAETSHERRGERVVVRVRATGRGPTWVESLELTKLPR